MKMKKRTRNILAAEHEFSGRPSEKKHAPRLSGYDVCPVFRG